MVTADELRTHTRRRRIVRFERTFERGYVHGYVAVVDVQPHRVVLREIDPDGECRCDDDSYALREITRVDFGCSYEDALWLVGGDPPDRVRAGAGACRLMPDSTPRQLLLGACFAIAFVGLLVALLACSFVVVEFLLFDPEPVGEPMVPETVSAFRFWVAVHAALSGLGLLASYALLGWTLRRLLGEPRHPAGADDQHG